MLVRARLGPQLLRKFHGGAHSHDGAAAVWMAGQVLQGLKTGREDQLDNLLLLVHCHDSTGSVLW